MLLSAATSSMTHVATRPAGSSRADARSEKRAERASMNWRVAAAVALIVVGVGAVGFVIVGPRFGGTDTQYLTSQATVTDVTNEVVGSGSIAPHASYALAFGAAPSLAGSTASGTGAGTSTITWPVETVNVTVGRKVKQGDVLATADATDAKVQLAADQAALTVAEVRLKADKAGATDAQIASAESSVRSARLAVANANASATQTAQSNSITLETAKNQLADANKALADAKAGPTTDTVAAAQDQVDSAQRAYDQAVQSQADTQASNERAIAQAQKTLDDAGLAVAQASQRLVNDEATGGSAATVAGDRSALDAANKAAANAQTSLDNTKAQATQSEQQAANGVANAKTALDKAKRDYTTTTSPSATAIGAAEQKVRDAELNLRSAQQRASASAQQSSQSASQAGLQLLNALASYTSTTTPVESTIASDIVAVTNAKAAVAESKLTVARATILAPVDGTVVAVNIVPGLTAPSGSAIVLDVGPLEVTADFSETSLAKIALGQSADVTVTAVGSTTPGKVTVIGATPASGGTSSVVTYPVTVALDQEPAGVQIGMTASVAIIIAQATNVVAVPTQALVGDATTGYEVRVMDGTGAITLVPVTVGLVTTSLAEIQSGLSGGETVVTGTVSAANSSSSSTRGNSIFGGGGIDFGGGPPPGVNIQRNTTNGGGGTNP
jgi:HlyD family secretion protein